MTLGSNDLQSDENLGSIRNSCDVFVTKPGELLIRPLAYLVCQVGKTRSEGVQMFITITAEKNLKFSKYSFW